MAMTERERCEVCGEELTDDEWELPMGEQGICDECAGALEEEASEHD